MSTTPEQTAEIDGLLSRLKASPPAQLTQQDIEIIKHLAGTVALQSAVIYQLGFKLSQLGAFDSMAHQTVSGLSIMGQIKNLLGTKAENDFTFADAYTRVDGFLNEVKTQAEAAKAFKSVATLALKFAPLLL